MLDFTDRLRDTCNAEFALWDNGAGRETWGQPQHSKDYYLFVKKYWVSIGNNNLDGRTTNAQGIRPAWSSAFVSFCVREAEAGNSFKYSEAHCHYTARAMNATQGNDPTSAYLARHSDDRKPQVGDIVVSGREYAASYDFETAAMIYEADSFYPSHGDIVVKVDNSYAHTIGGNITHNVDQKRLRLTDQGYLRNRINSSGNELPWIAVLECVR